MLEYLEHLQVKLPELVGFFMKHRHLDGGRRNCIQNKGEDTAFKST